MKDFKFKIDGTEFAAQVEEQGEGKLQVTLNGKAYSVDVEGMKAKAPKVTPIKVAAPQPAPAAPVQAAAPKAAPTAGGNAITAPLPGTVTAIKVAAGQAVKKGDVVVIMEAMKMANEIVSEWDGTVSAVNVQQGASVNVGDALITIA